MACIFTWMASFFTMAIFCKYIGIAWFTRKEKDFLQVQSEHCKRLCNDIPRLEKCLEDIGASTSKKVLNKNQCVHLFGKLILAMKGIDQMLSSATEDLKFQSIFEELCYLQKKIEIVGKNCTEQDQWCHLAVFQLQNKETFRELLLDLKCCYDTTRDMYLFHHPNPSMDILPTIHFDASTYQQVLEDGQVLKRKLELVLEGEELEDYEIAQHLLLRLRNLDRVDGGDLDALEVPSDFHAPRYVKKIGVGSYGDVFQSNWLGLACATKVLKGGRDSLINCRKELGIVAGLSHPNLVQFVACGTNKNLDELVEDDESGEMYLAMELMESSLSTILRNVKRPLPYHVAVDIMHQIAKGVYYLHDMQVAHLDLKPANVLTSSTPFTYSRVSNHSEMLVKRLNDKVELKFHYIGNKGRQRLRFQKQGCVQKRLILTCRLSCKRLQYVCGHSASSHHCYPYIHHGLAQANTVCGFRGNQSRWPSYHRLVWFACTAQYTDSPRHRFQEID